MHNHGRCSHAAHGGRRTAGGRAAALELNGPSPRAWLPVAAGGVRDEAALALSALAVLWDPAR